MSVGLIVLSGVSALVLLGVTQRVLDRMQLSDRAALVIALSMLAGGFVPDIRVGRVAVNLGGAVIPLLVCLWLLIKTDTRKEVVRSLVGSVLTAGAVFALGRLLPDEPERMALDPQYIYGLAGGVAAYLLGRSRRGAFICGVLGMTLADIANALLAWNAGVNQTLTLGGAGALDSIVLSGILAVLLSEFLGELLERLSRGPVRAGRRKP